MAGWLFVITLIVALVAVHRPFGDYLYRVVTGSNPRDSHSLSCTRRNT